MNEIAKKLGEVLESIYEGEDQEKKDYLTDLFCGACRPVSTELGEIKYKDEEGGGYDGRDGESIFEFEGKFYSLSYRYNSWDSNYYYFDTVKEVEQKEETVLVWKAKVN